MFLRCLTLLFGLLAVPVHGIDLFVDQSAPAGGRGFSWAQAYRSLEVALADSNLDPGNTIFIAQGTYLASGSFDIKSGITLRGGFASGGVIHDPTRYETILSTNSPQPIVRILSGPSSTLTDLTIANGAAGGIVIEPSTAPVLRNLLITENTTTGNGGGIFVSEGGNEIPLFEGITFYRNSASAGAALYLQKRSATVKACRFVGNLASNQGGGVFHQESTSSYTNCLFHHNAAANGAGGAAVDDALSNVSYLNCTFAANVATLPGAALHILADRITAMSNSIVAGVQEAQLSNLLLDQTSRSNLLSGQDPKFLNPNGADNLPGTLDDDFRLSPDSPAIEAGANFAFPLLSTAVDLRGVKRSLDADGTGGPTIDMGAYEFLPVIYVNRDLLLPLGQEDGLTWDTAFTRLQDALTEAVPFTQVWVASGTYFPDLGRNFGPGNRNSTFTLESGVELYGGFNITFGLNTFAERTPQDSPSILSGDLQDDDDPDFPTSFIDNAYHVVSGANVDASTYLDGFIIQNGRATGLQIDQQQGAGIQLSNSSPVISDCSFLDNIAVTTGGGIFSAGGMPRISDCRFEKNSAFTGGGINLDASAPLIERCHFQENIAQEQGGGIFSKGTSSVGIQSCTFVSNTTQISAGACYIGLANLATYLNNCLFSGNSTALDGGAVSVLSPITFTNCSFTGNFAGERGGGISLRSSARLINCSFQGNAAETQGGGALVGFAGTPRFTNCIVWNNRAQDSTTTQSASFLNLASTSFLYSHCLIENFNPSGIGNLSGTNPANNPSFLFTVPPALEPTTGSDLRLRPNSPVRNLGDNAATLIALDLASKPRLRESRIDLGAYEHQPTFNTLYPTSSQDGDENANGFPNFIEYAAGYDPTISNHSSVAPRLTSGGLFTFTLRTDNPEISARLESSTTLSEPFTVLHEGQDYFLLNRMSLTPEREQLTYLLMPGAAPPRNFFRVNYLGSFINPD